MVNYEDIIRAMELREVILRFLQLRFHPLLRNTFGLDMDHIQGKVYKELPEFNIVRGVIALIVSAIYWQVQLIVLHQVIQISLRALKRYFPSNNNVLALSKQDQWLYTWHVHSAVHAVVGVLAALYGLFYADGQHGTTWFHCNFYKLNMFDVQKYLSTISLGFYLQDFLFLIQNPDTKNSSNQMQLLAHHVFLIAGNAIALWLGGFFGSASQISFILEASTPFSALHVLLAYHKREDSMLYKVNAAVMTFMFFIFRVCFLYYMVFQKCQNFLMYRHISFWLTYPPHKKIWGKVCFMLYNAMYLLNLFWFFKILWGLMKGLGVTQAVYDTERIPTEETDSDDTDETEDETKKQKRD